MVHQDERLIELRSRKKAGGPWTIQFAHERAPELMLNYFNLEIAVVDLYRGTEL